MYLLKIVVNNASILYEGSLVVVMRIKKEKRMQEKLSN